MNALHKILSRAVISVCIAATLAGGDARSAEPTLARLTFWVPPEKQAEFAVAFDQRMLSLLKQQGLIESNEQGRPTIEGTLTWLFETSSAAEVLAVRSALESDPGWVSVLAEFEKVFGPVRGMSPYAGPFLDFAVYRAPAGPGKKLQVGPGRSKHLESGTSPWHTISKQGRIPGKDITAMLQTRDGNLWFGTDAGIVRFDGFAYETFTTEDGLASNYVKCIAEDREGNIWVGTGIWWHSGQGGGVSCYDGSRWVNYDEKDGLAGRDVAAILQDSRGAILSTADGIPDAWFCSMLFDRRGHLWIATSAGICRYDGKVFQALTIEDGLPSNFTNELLEDRRGDVWIGSPVGVTRFRPVLATGRRHGYLPSGLQSY